jgi:DNA-directed RNA polymerase subunit M/transcription elongation factor TFIIS
MHFCSNCHNMYYIMIDTKDDNKLIYYCRNCKNEDSFINNGQLSVSKTNIIKNEENYNNIINKFTKLDPTLPRTNKILCPNLNCDTNKKNFPREIIYIRYDDTNIKYIYLCSTCDTVWK